MVATQVWSPVSAATAAFCEMLQAFEVDCPWMIAIASPIDISFTVTGAGACACAAPAASIETAINEIENERIV